ncbi:hypothetical protein TTHERM_000494748 (macronuclear) [Tetrahymena thermophila SB210]|uniref:Uncharacterized protein n=1 Tax=Tetrahymena thermophila (strain SB210) TaxID=312017 RepID=W7XER5_TETTS|nr:hypothetical protein TTHERM_000494748 [Tetrahymena thermophila SB210]EWS72396.1 hypothetical protein TTHERM_000494748 [Tetrahymena thermophila SB210]|eukprot:XP_012655080.1 hypothetical protein TTHERM_000494748 [Tetrahymena thermophila SB210]
MKFMHDEQKIKYKQIYCQLSNILKYLFEIEQAVCQKSVYLQYQMKTCDSNHTKHDAKIIRIILTNIYLNRQNFKIIPFLLCLNFQENLDFLQSEIIISHYIILEPQKNQYQTDTMFKRVINICQVQHLIPSISLQLI